MTTRTRPDRPLLSAAAPAGRALPPWAPAATLTAILAAAAVLYGWAIGSAGWSDMYYSAAVKSMGGSWTGFLFGSFDPAGVLTIDKPPAGLWPQVLSTKLFGMHGWSLLLPEVVEGVAAVFVLHRTVRRWAGEGAGLVAALVLTLTPVTVAVTRSNLPDTLLILLLVLAAYALTRALAENARATTWLCACGFLIGCGFLTKMVAAWVIVPALAAAWLVGARGGWASRLWRLAVAGAVLVASSLWWVVLFSLWPGHPYTGSTTDGSPWNLVLFFNGLGRITGGGDDPMAEVFGEPVGTLFGGPPGPFRMFGAEAGGQIGWLLPVCAVALGVALWTSRPGRGPRLPAEGWVLWGGWLVVGAAVFSAQKGTYHTHYTALLAPAVAALSGGLVATLFRASRDRARWVRPVGAAAVAMTTVWAVLLVRREPSWHGWLVWPVLLTGAAAVLLVLAAGRYPRLLPVGLGAALTAALVTPAAWSATAWEIPTGLHTMIPTVGPEQPVFRKFPGPPPPELSDDQREILAYALRGAPSARITLAVEGGAMSAAPYLLGSDATVVGMGGFAATDDAPSVRQLRRWSANGDLRYVLIPGNVAGYKFAPGTNPIANRIAWVTTTCTPTATYTAGTLYDCTPR